MAATTIADHGPPHASPAPPDSAAVRRWVGHVLRPWLGWGLAAAGLAVIGLGWYGISGTAVVGKQIPYLISGGVGGIALILVGGFVLLLQDVRATAHRVDRMEHQLAQLHDVLLVEADTVAPHAGPEAPARGVAELLALGTGRTYHRSGCTMVQAKDDVAAVDEAQIAERGLRPCKLCEPGAPGAGVR